MIAIIRRLALPIAVVSMIVNLIILVVSMVLWWLAIVENWLDSVTFVSNVSMLALVFSLVCQRRGGGAGGHLGVGADRRRDGGQR